ncbi:winged helix-turn-helix transcriptional regulator, partial [Polymorphobacter sp.]|uniref:winged helix-turn-helix transcriptional regulator n=1 Tax=Polymorphobacter sp. TaxID=1909290 RepID=UPI003F70BEE3
MNFQKVTQSWQSLHGRWYGDACGTAFAMELLGERWALLIVRELMFGSRRFTDLRASLPGI